MVQGLATVLLFVLPMVAWGLTLGRTGLPEQGAVRFSWDDQAAVATWMLVFGLVALGASVAAGLFGGPLVQAVCLGSGLAAELILGGLWLWGRLPDRQVALSASHGAISSDEISVSTDSREIVGPSVLKR